MSVRNNLTIGRGEIKSHRIFIDNAPPGGIGSFTFRLVIYQNPTSTTALLNKTTGFTVLDADTVEILWAEADTLLTPGVYPYVFMEATTNLGLSYGSITIRHGIPDTINASTVFPLTPGLGGTGSDLSATGPGILQQPDVGANITVIPHAFATTNAGAFDITTSNKHARTLDGTNSTLSVTGDRIGQPFMIKLVQNGTGGHTPTWWSGITWYTSDFSAPTIAALANKATTMVFQKTGVGAYDGYLVGKSGA